MPQTLNDCRVGRFDSSTASSAKYRAVFEMSVTRVTQGFASDRTLWAGGSHIELLETPQGVP